MTKIEGKLNEFDNNWGDGKIKQISDLIDKDIREELKSFLKTALTETRADTLKEIEEKMPKEFEDKDEAWNELVKLDMQDSGLAEGSMALRNQALQEFQQLLDKLTSL